MRFAFWSGHSHGRYAGSAWYADHAWRELERRCVLHMNVDSTGARGATDYTVFHATEDAADFAEAVVADLTGQRGRARHFSRAGDQSFWGIGLPSAFMSMSQLPPQDTEFGRTIERLVGTSGFPWWWHTRDDTIDKIDPAVLALDTRVYAAAALRLCNAPVLPLAPARAARAVAQAAGELHAAAGGQFDLSPIVEAALGLADALAAHDGWLARQAADAAAGEAAGSNRALMRLSRALVPLLYTTGDRFAHDLAVGIPPLAGLAPVRGLGRDGPGLRSGQVHARRPGARTQPRAPRPRRGDGGGRALGPAPRARLSERRLPMKSTRRAMCVLAAGALAVGGVALPRRPGPTPRSEAAR